jgi:hypothetical protein
LAMLQLYISRLLHNPHQYACLRGAPTITYLVEQLFARRVFLHLAKVPTRSHAPSISLRTGLGRSQCDQIRRAVIARSGVTATRLLCDPLPYKNVLKVPHAKNLGENTVLACRQNVPSVLPDSPACGTPDRALAFRAYEAIQKREEKRIP